MSFGDKDLLDVWDDGDAVEFKLALLVRILAELRQRHDEARRQEAVRLGMKLLAAVFEIRERVDLLIADLETV